MNPTWPSTFAALLAAFSIPSQSTPPAAASGIRTMPTFDLPDLVPLHTQPAVAGQPDYGWRAGGPTWKASFHDGFRFHPYRGPDRELASWHWRTQSITIGGTPLSLAVRGSTQTETRYETVYPQVREVYEMRREGVEQTFVFPHRPAAVGDLIVTGQVLGDLISDDRAPEHAALTFEEHGQPTVRYGRAYAFDAGGARIPIATSSDHGCIRLHVPAAFVASARFPLTIDPLIGSELINTSFSSAPTLSVATTASTTLDQMVVSFVRQFASNDMDAFSVVGKQDFTGFQFHWIDTATGYSVPDLDVAYCAGSRSYVIAYTRQVPIYTTPYVYLQRDDQMQYNAGTTVGGSLPIIGTSWLQPSVGGGYGTCSKALCAWTNWNGTERNIRLGLVDTAAPGSAIFMAFPQGGFGSVDCDQPDIMPMTRDGLPWRVAWRADLGGSNEIRTATINQNAVSTPFVAFDTTTDQLDTPQIAGAYSDTGGRWLLVWERDALINSAVRATDFSPSGPQSIASGPALSLRSLSADHKTGSNFLLSYSTILTLGPTTLVARLGGSGAVIDTDNLGTTGALDMCFKPSGAPGFLLAYDHANSLRQIRGTRFAYPADAESEPFGLGCSSTELSAPYPFAGNRNFAITAGNLAPATPLLLALGVTTTNVGLQPFGYPCSLLVTPFTTIGAVSAGSAITIRLPLPDDPIFLGDLFAQAFLPFSLEATSGLRMSVR